MFMKKVEYIEMQKYYIEQMVTYLPAMRQVLKITQKQLAEKIGLTRQTIVSFENRQRPLPWNVYLSLVLFFQQHELSLNMIDKLNLFEAKILREELQ